MMKGYLTVFLALSLSLLAGFLLFLTEGAIQNAGRIRLECAVDTSMNAVLSEYHIGLFERYGLLYVDASYLNREPCVDNMLERMNFYLKANTEEIRKEKGSPWGIPLIQKTDMNSFETAAAEMGASMRHQAVLYTEDAGIIREEEKALEYTGAISELNNAQPMSEWNAVMEQLAGMELPVEMDTNGILQEVPLSNPADWVYELAGSDVLFLSEVNEGAVCSAKVKLDSYISHRGAISHGYSKRKFRDDKDLFLIYLFDKMACLQQPREETLLSCQIEYMAIGKASDLENVRAVAQELMRWRFADNLSLALVDSGLRAEAEAAALELYAVQLKEDFKTPVTISILYACAFLESIADMRSIYSTGRVPVRKTAHGMSVEHVKNGTIYTNQIEEGLGYKQYLACLLLLVEEKLLNFRAMDVMEMDLRRRSQNSLFAMDWCVERFEATVEAKGCYGGKLYLRRKYGFF